MHGACATGSLHGAQPCMYSQTQIYPVWRATSGVSAGRQCRAINVGFELDIGIQSKLSISIVGFDFEMGEFCHFDFDIDMICIQYQYQ